jgi:hypothetical protein
MMCFFYIMQINVVINFNKSIKQKVSNAITLEVSGVHVTHIHNVGYHPP